MVPFKNPKWRTRIIDEKYKHKDRVIHRAVKKMEIVMRGAVEFIIDHYVTTGRYAEPTLNEMYGVSDDFYYNVVHAAFQSAESEKKAILNNEPKKNPDQTVSKVRMSGLPIGIPRSLKGLEKLFRDKRYWPKIMKRSKALTDRVRKAYLRKLQRKFKTLVTDLDTNKMTPAEAKDKMMESWDASKSRVELIFRTETTTYFGKTQTAFFAGDPDIIGFLFDAVRDTSSTEWCRSRHGLIYKPGSTGEKGLAYNTPAIHWNCRSHLIPLANIEYNRKMLADPHRDPEKRKVKALPPGWRT